jgi:hypothetical protein
VVRSTRAVSAAAVRSNRWHLKQGRICTLGKFNFADTLLTELELSNSVSFISPGAFSGTRLNSFSFHPCPMSFSVRCGMLEDASGRLLMLYFGWAASVEIPQSIETIGCCYFDGKKTLERVIFEADKGRRRSASSQIAWQRSGDISMNQRKICK